MTIEVRNIVKKFGAFAALDNVDLKVAQGELLALLGPSGSGKTTLLRIIAGLDWPDSGEVWIDGEDALAHGASERHVGFVFQHYALFRHMTVFENVAFGLRVKPRDLRPSEAEYFNQHYQQFVKKMVTGLLGEKLAAIYQPEDLPKLALLFERGTLAEFLKNQGQENLLAGWFGIMLPFYGTLAVDDHDLWIYFTARFGIKVIEHLEPKPGIAPTTKHLGEVVEKMRAEKVKLILTTPYYDPSHARFVAEQTGAKIAKMAHQVESLSTVTDYFKLVDHNVQKVVAILSVR